MEEKNQQLNRAVLELIVPSEILDCFDLHQVEESADGITLTLHEHKERIPGELQGSDVVLDGFCNPIELHSFPQKGKAMFLRLYRRRWRLKAERGNITQIPINLHRKAPRQPTLLVLF